MNKSEIVAIVADKVELTKKDATTAVDAVFEAILEALNNNEKVNIAGFGIFEMKEKAERKGRNPRTGEEILIPASKNVAFKPSKSLKEEK